MHFGNVRTEHCLDGTLLSTMRAFKEEPTFGPLLLKHEVQTAQIALSPLQDFRVTPEESMAVKSAAPTQARHSCTLALTDILLRLVRILRSRP